MQLEPTPSIHSLACRPADFATLTEALDYAAQGDTGLNFYASAKLSSVLSYRQLAADAQALAKKLLASGLCRGDRVALIAETEPYFIRFFFACQYAGLIPVPLPATIRLGGHQVLVNQLKHMLEACTASLAVTSRGFLPQLQEAGKDLGLAIQTPEYFEDLPAEDNRALPAIRADDIAFIQYTSGSTRFPKGVVVTQQSAMTNLEAIARQGVKLVPGDRCVSWLPLYHDMGLVGCMLTPVASQLSVDYLSTVEFTMRPSQWLAIITANRGTISFGPCFGYELCARRLRSSDIDKYDLSSWRIAGVGAEMIRPQSLELFASKLAPAGFNPTVFMPCYGMAECTLAVSFTEPGAGYTTDYLDLNHLATGSTVQRIEPSARSVPGRHFVSCGRVIDGYEVEIRDDDGTVLGDNRVGIIYLRGQGIMAGYFALPDETSEVLSADGWFCTGDIGYLANGYLTLTGRKKDLIIINARNIWPQDIEHLCETQPEVRVGDVVAFSVTDADDNECCVVLVQCRETDPDKRQDLHQRLTALVREELSLDCLLELVPPRFIPVTSSGKRSRSRARLAYLNQLQQDCEPLPVGEPEYQQAMAVG